MKSVNQTKPKPILFAAAFERRKMVKTRKGFRKVWFPDVEYFHAENTTEARIKFTAGNSMELIHKQMRIVAIAPAIGFHHDDNGENRTMY